MQEIKKRRIVIASVLKPVDDTRMSAKIGCSLTSRGDVHVIGFPSDPTTKFDGVTLHPIHDHKFKRLSIKRLTAPFSFFKQAYKLRGDDVIICTHELLSAAMLLKLLTGCRIFYDVRENYFRNILFTNAFPAPIRPFLAAYVRLKEYILSPWIDHFFLAEKSYQHEFSFQGSRATVLENKSREKTVLTTERKNRKDARTKLLFSGTLSSSTGVDIAVDLATKLHSLDPSIALTIIGYTSKGDEYVRIQRLIAEKPFIRLVGGNSLVSHDHIVKEIQSSDFGIIAYPPNPSTRDAIPTKLYEYLASQLPILLVDNPVWTKKCAMYPAAVPFSPFSFDPATVLAAMRTTTFYQTIPQDVTWDSEEQRLLRLF
jgi:glycosyltransferase involved in cell wall biosynthesis